MSDAETAEDPWEDYDSGPYCRHWSTPWDCDELCYRCGHTCAQHYGDDSHECEVADCRCAAFGERSAP